VENNEQIQSKTNDSYSIGDCMMSPQINELATSLAKAQSEFEIAGKASANPFFKSKYADLTAVVNASRPALVKNGLSVIQSVMNLSDGNSYLVTLLMHSSGQWIKSKAKHSPVKNDVQSLSSYNTYLKRMCYSSLVGVLTGDEDDDDGNAASGSNGNGYRSSQNEIQKINPTQLAIITKKIGDYTDIAVRMKNGYSVSNISDLPADKFDYIIDRIDEIKRKEYGTVEVL
jgi:hypothetical protein